MRLLLRRLCVLCLVGVCAPSWAFVTQAFSGYAQEIPAIAGFDRKNQKPIQLNTLLVLPRTAPPWKAVVLPSNCAGLRDEFWQKITPVLLEKGLAVALLDSFTPRGFADVCSNKFQMWQEDRVHDAQAVLAHLQADPRMDARKIVLGGHSNGALTAFFSAYQEASPALQMTDGSFAAYFGVGTSCEVSFKSPALRAPLLLISGEKDDYTLPQPCVAEVRRLQAAGSPADIVLIAGANHNMSTGGWIYSSAVQRMPRGIPRMFMQGRQPDGNMLVELEDGSRMSSRQMLVKYGGFLLSGTRGATIGGNWDRFPEVSAAIVGLLDRTGFFAP
jgi:dienelactone hydrolase